jgi:hypothetical protein
VLAKNGFGEQNATPRLALGKTRLFEFLSNYGRLERLARPQRGLASAVLKGPRLSELMLKPRLGEVRRKLVLPLLVNRADAVSLATCPLPL